MSKIVDLTGQRFGRLIVLRDSNKGDKRMKDLCQVCKNFSVCPYGEGEEIDPKVKQWEEVDFIGEQSGCWIVVKCNLFKEYPKQEDSNDQQTTTKASA